MAITDINISEQLETGAPSIKYTGNEGPQPSQQHQQEMMIAQQIWEALSPEQQGQFQNFEQFFASGVWKQILQQMQADEGQGPGPQGPQPGAQGIAGLGPDPMAQQMPAPNRMGAEYGGRIGYRYGSPHSSPATEAYSSMGETDESALMEKVYMLMQVFGLSKDEAIQRATSSFRKPLSPPQEIRPPQEPLRPRGLPNMGRPVEDFREEQIGIETLRGRR